MNAAIAQHLTITQSAILRVEEWANVLFVVAKGIGARFVSKKAVKKMEPKYIQLETYRSKGINAYLAPEEGGKANTTKAMYGKPVAGQEDKAHKAKRHTVEVRIDNLPDGKYIYKEAGGADFNKSRYGWIVLKSGEIVEEG